MSLTLNKLGLIKNNTQHQGNMVDMFLQFLFYFSFLSEKFAQPGTTKQKRKKGLLFVLQQAIPTTCQQSNRQPEADQKGKGKGDNLSAFGLWYKKILM